MNCPKCSVPVEDGMLTCPSCGEQIAANAQKEKINAEYETTKTIVKKRLHTRLFLSIAIFLTIMLVIQIAAMVSTVAGILLGLVPVIFMGISMVSAYKLYTQKPELNFKKSLRRVSLYDACTKVFYKIILISVIVAGVIAVLGSLGIDLYNAIQLSEAETLPNGQLNPYYDDVVGSIFYYLDMITPILVIVACSLVVVVLSLFKAVYELRQKAFLNLSKAVDTGVYKPVKKKVFSLSCVVGAFTILFGIILMVAPAFVGMLINMLKDLIPFVATLGGFLIAGSLSIGLSGIFVGIYLILSAAWLNGTQKELLVNNGLIEFELKELDRLNDAVRDQKFQKEKEEKEAIAAAKAAKAEERILLENDRKDRFIFKNCIRYLILNQSFHNCKEQGQ